MSVAAKQVDFISIRARLWNGNYGGGRFLLQERVAAHEVFIGGRRHGDHECFFGENENKFVLSCELRSGPVWVIFSHHFRHLASTPMRLRPIGSTDVSMWRFGSATWWRQAFFVRWQNNRVTLQNGSNCWWRNFISSMVRQCNVFVFETNGGQKHIYNPPLKNIEGLLSAENRGATNTGNTPMPPACGDQISEWRSANFMELGAQRTWCVINDWMPTRSYQWSGWHNDR